MWWWPLEPLVLSGGLTGKKYVWIKKNKNNNNNFFGPVASVLNDGRHTNEQEATLFKTPSQWTLHSSLDAPLLIYTLDLMNGRI